MITRNAFLGGFVSAIAMTLFVHGGNAGEVQASDANRTLSVDNGGYQVAVLPASSYDGTHDWVSRIEATGALVTVVASPRILLVYCSEEQLVRIRSAGISIGNYDIRTSLTAGATFSPSELAVINVATEGFDTRVADYGQPEDPRNQCHFIELQEELVSMSSTSDLSAADLRDRSEQVNGRADVQTYEGKADTMTGHIALGLFLFESDGTIDPDRWDWQSFEVDSVAKWVTDAMSKQAVDAAILYAQRLTWHIIVFGPTDSLMQVPWQSQYHAGSSPGLQKFQFDTLPAHIYNNFGLPGDSSWGAGYQTGGTWNNRSWACNQFLADSATRRDSMVVHQGVHHFIQHLPDTCGSVPAVTSEFFPTAMFSRAAWYKFRRSTWPSNPCSNYSWSETSGLKWGGAVHENSHIWGSWDEGAQDCYPGGDAAWIIGVNPIVYYPMKNMNYNVWDAGSSCPFPNFTFVCGLGSPPMCPSTARQIGWWGHDFGDAWPPYPTELSENGAYHKIGGFEWLGGSVPYNGYGSVSFENDADSVSPQFLDQDGRRNLAIKDGDKLDNGVYFTGQLNDGALDSFRVVISNHGTGSHRYFDADTGKLYLNAWFDWNGDRDWNDAGEQVISSFSLIPANNDDLSDTILFTVTPPSGYADTFWVRFRLDYGEDCGQYIRRYSDAGLDGPVGAAVYGEVEDYYFTNGYFWVRGDIDDNHIIDVIDVSLLNAYIFQAGEAPDPVEKGDIDCNGWVDIIDYMKLYNYVFRHAAPPCARQ